jgi:vacuolar iron transporter family protein
MPTQVIIEHSDSGLELGLPHVHSTDNESNDTPTEGEPVQVSPTKSIQETLSSPRKSNMRQEHLGGSRQYWRDIILGVNDGLVSTFLLVAGVAGGGMTSRNILLTALAGAIAGALSMCAGEYVATKSQKEVLHGEIALEEAHIRDYLEDEMVELEGLFDLIGLDKNRVEIRRQLSEYYRYNPKSLLLIMISLEFGVLEKEERSPFKAGFTSCGLFLLGTIPSVIPFIFTDDATLGVILAAVMTTVSLLAVGALKTWASHGKWYEAAFENLFIAGIGGSIAYGVGILFDTVIIKK